MLDSAIACVLHATSILLGRIISRRPQERTLVVDVKRSSDPRPSLFRRCCCCCCPSCCFFPLIVPPSSTSSSCLCSESGNSATEDEATVSDSSWLSNPLLTLSSHHHRHSLSLYDDSMLEYCRAGLPCWCLSFVITTNRMRCIIHGSMSSHERRRPIAAPVKPHVQELLFPGSVTSPD